jgi:hypothetical protein
MPQAETLSWLIQNRMKAIAQETGLFLERASSPKRQTAKMVALRYYSAFFGAAAASLTNAVLAWVHWQL